MIEKSTKLFNSKIPFIIISDFLSKHIEVYTLDEAKKEGIEFSFNSPNKSHNINLTKTPVSFESYKKKFNRVIEEIKKGNTYLLNLTQPTFIKTTASLDEIYKSSNAAYKIKYKDNFVCFSPESFIQIKNNKIYTYPMKGTIDASIPDAKKIILEDKKELAEHIMIVDLLRNDLGIIATNIKVEEFRYITKIKLKNKTLLQVSSKISGDLPKDFDFGESFKKLLPAGSISGTPKRKTVEIIQNTEGYNRGFFSGVFGYFDGNCFDSCVLIRYIEKTKKGLVYKSGGGITIDSDVKKEYQEMIDKVYIP